MWKTTGMGDLLSAVKKKNPVATFIIFFRKRYEFIDALIVSTY